MSCIRPGRVVVDEFQFPVGVGLAQITDRPSTNVVSRDSVNNEWEPVTGSTACHCASQQASAVRRWHLGQWRSWQALYQGWA